MDSNTSLTAFVLAYCGGEVIVQNSEFCDGENTDQHLLDPSQPASFGGLDAVYRAVKEKGKKTSRKQVRDWLSQQDVYTLHKPARRRYKRIRVIVFGMDEQFQADLDDLQNLSRYNKGYKYLLTCIHIFFIYIVHEPIMIKRDGASLGKSIVSIEVERRSLVSLHRIRSRKTLTRHLISMEERIFSLGYNNGDVIDSMHITERERTRNAKVTHQRGLSLLRHYCLEPLLRDCDNFFG